jgi:serine protease Do
MVKSYSLAGLGIVLDASGTVTDLTTNSPAADAGLALGDRILTVNGDEVDLATFELTEPALILVQAPGGVTRHLRLDPWTPSDGVRPVGGANVLDPAVVVF